MRRRALALRVAVSRLRSASWLMLAMALVGVLVAFGQCAALLLRARQAVGASVAPSLGDYVAFLMAGTPQPAPLSLFLEPQRFVLVPFGWLATVLLPAAVTSLAFGGAADPDPLLVASGSRWGHFAGRCLAVLACGAGYWATLTLVCAAAAGLSGGEMSLTASSWLPQAAGLAHETQTQPPYQVGAFYGAAILFSLALLLAQLAASDAWGSRIGFIAVAALVVGSVYLMTPALPGNLMMAARSSVFVGPWQIEVEVGRGALQAGIDSAFVMAAAGALAAAALAWGALVARGKDYLGSDER